MPTEPQDYYDDSPQGPPEPPAKPAEDAKTSILPRSFFADDVKPGDKLNVEVKAVHENDVEVTASQGDQDEDDTAAPEEAPTAPSDSGGGADDMSSMMG